MLQIKQRNGLKLEDKGKGFGVIERRNPGWNEKEVTWLVGPRSFGFE